MFSCPPSINKNKDLENWNSNIWRLWCREQVICHLAFFFLTKKLKKILKKKSWNHNIHCNKRCIGCLRYCPQKACYFCKEKIYSILDRYKLRSARRSKFTCIHSLLWNEICLVTYLYNAVIAVDPDISSLSVSSLRMASSHSRKL